jgi:mannose-6-phosphate isomerase-like protein (cupin superfamily)
VTTQGIDAQEDMMKGFLRVGVIAASLLVAAPTTSAQAPSESGALFFTAADMQQMAAAYPGLNAGAKSIDAGAHVVDFWLESRKGGAAGSASGIVHSEITEIYYIFQGKATIITGGTLADPKPFAVDVPAWKGSSVVFNTPTLGGPFKGGTPRAVGPGDIIVVPPGTVHQWGTVETPMLVYFIARIDPSKKLTAGYLNPALAGKP